MSETKKLRTALQKKRDKRDLEIVKEWEKMTAIPEQSKTVVTKLLMKKYGIYSAGTIYDIRKRVQARREAAV